MKSFALNENGDLAIENNEILLAENEELTRQKIKNIISTNKGEWFLNWEEGITFSHILGKNVTDEETQAEIQEGMQQVDETLTMTEFGRSVEGRKSTVSFKAVNEENNTEIEVIGTWD